MVNKNKYEKVSFLKILIRGKFLKIIKKAEKSSKMITFAGLSCRTDKRLRKKSGSASL